MERTDGQKIYGFTGEIGRDGILTPDLQALLEQKQHEASLSVLDRLEKREANHLFPMAAMATGIGKTRVEHEVIERWKSNNPTSKILFVAGTKLTLVEQAKLALTSYQQDSNGSGGYTESEELERDVEETENVEETLKVEQEDLPFYRVGRFKDEGVDVKVATMQTLQSASQRGNLNLSEFDLVIVDEVHNIGTPQRAAIIKQFRNVVGFTATPHRHSGRMKRPEEYGFEVVYNSPLLEAQKLRLLPPLLGMQIVTTGLIEEIPTTMNGQIDYKRLEQILKKSPELRPFIADKVADIIRDGEKEYKTVMAVNFVWEAQEIARLLKARNIRVGLAVNQQAARQIHSDDIPAIETIERYKLPQSDPQSVQVLISPYVAAEGFDAPFTEVFTWASPTDSELRYTQYTGRLARRSEGKLFGLNLDFLYQTSQYGWSYNMGMWMKGNISQLPSGLLYLGPEQDIAGLAGLEVVQRMKSKGDVVDVSELQKGPLEEIKEGELPLHDNGLRDIFIGKWSSTLEPLLERVKDKARFEDPDWYNGSFVQRTNGSRVIDVCTDRSRFIQLALKLGGKLKDPSRTELLPIQETDLSLSYENLIVTFSGKKSKVVTAADVVKEKIKKEQPELFIQLFVRRISGNHNDCEVCINRALFVQMMRKEGVSLKDESLKRPIQQNELVLSRTELESLFIGHISKGRGGRLKRIVDRVKNRVRVEDPIGYKMMFVKRQPRNVVVDVCTDKARFIALMLEEGAALR